MVEIKSCFCQLSISAINCNCISLRISILYKCICVWGYELICWVLYENNMTKWEENGVGAYGRARHRLGCRVYNQVHRVCPGPQRTNHFCYSLLKMGNGKRINEYKVPPPSLHSKIMQWTIIKKNRSLSIQFPDLYDCVAHFCPGTSYSHNWKCIYTTTYFSEIMKGCNIEFLCHTKNDIIWVWISLYVYCFSHNSGRVWELRFSLVFSMLSPMSTSSLFSGTYICYM